MAMIRFCAAIVALALSAGALRTAPAKKAEAVAPANKTEATKTEVDALHKRLELMATGLEGMLTKGSLSKAKIASTLELFLKQLKGTLDDTKGMKDYGKAMKRLVDARAGVASLTKDLAAQQESLMREDAEQKESLLLGVLMTHQKAPMAEQLDILKSGDFSQLPVAKVLLAKHSDKVALFAQAAEYLDKHGSGKGSLASKAKDVRAHIEVVAADLDKRVMSLTKYENARKARHEALIKSLTEREKKASKQAKHRIELMKKKQERQYKKSYAMSHRDIVYLREAAAAVRKGDMAALNKARSALQKSLQAMQATTGNFLHFLQLSHRVLRRDCPYCAAQCVDKCHQAGKSYTTCLMDCADAGKGK